MSAGAITGTASAADLPEDNTILELTAGENPLTFLTMNAKTVLGMIAWMDDLDRIEGWRRAEANYVDSDRDVVLEALERQRLSLERGDELPIYHPEVHERYDSDTDPLEDADDVDQEQTAADDSSATVHEKHPDATGLEVGQVLEIDRGETTEFVWPACAGEDSPYLLREFDSSDDLRQEMTLSADDIYGRLEFDPERRPAEDIHIQPPANAAVNRGE